MPKSKTPAVVIPMPVIPPADRIPELRARLRELSAIGDAIITLLAAMRPQRARNLAVVPKPRRRK